MTFIGAGDFEKVGQEFKNYFIEFADLRPSEKVLDVGCGIGRMAIPLTNYLSKEGEYWGFDIVEKGIKWCQRHISSKFSNFHFQHSNVYNNHYNNNGIIQASDYKFPYDNESFDFVFLTSVFTHMLPVDLENYLREISRVLKPEGKCLITLFIINEESESLIRSGNSFYNFTYNMSGCMSISEKDPEAAIAYSEEFIFRLFEKYGLEISQPIHYGSWCKRDNFLSFQDLIIAKKMMI
jgi:ubiquinone/menaquinone biosynthesis C-methylase UbiE